MADAKELIVGVNGGRAVFSARRTLPQPLNGEISALLCELYEKICVCVKENVKQLIAKADGAALYKAVLDFCVTVEGEGVKLIRHIKVFRGTETLVENTSEQSFLTVDEKALIACKNSKKQRFIPLRNAKNIKKMRDKSKNPTD